MATFKRFEDIGAWQKGRVLANAVYKASNSGRFARDFGLRDQIRRAAVSVVSNIAEGFERGGNKEFMQFLSLSRGSCGELATQLYLAADQQYITAAEFHLLYAQASEVNRMLSGLINYLQKATIKGVKFRA